MFKYFPHTDEDIEAMKRAIGIASVDELFSDVPKDVFFRRKYNLPDAMSEIELRAYFDKLGKANSDLVCFAGLGTYDHYDPAVIKSLTSRQEFLTAYTPYQPEVSQGTLQYIFEFQSMIQILTGMDAANASMYDGATATAEACFMAESIARRKLILVSKTVNPYVTDVLKTYCRPRGISIEIIPETDGITDIAELEKMIDGNVAAVVAQKPNFFGLIEDFGRISEIIHANGSVFIENADLSALGILKTPKEDGADIVVGDCQTLGIPMSYGGPGAGYMATIKAHIRKLPGRIVGLSKDVDGKRAYVLTLQAREQHIRREKANSNICSNQSLMALYVTIYLSLMGPEGLREVNELSYQGAHYLYDRLIATGKFRPAFKGPFLKEFCLKTNIPASTIQEVLLKNGIFGAIPMGEFGEEYQNMVSFAVTEKRTKEEIEHLVSLLEVVA
ncbi:MAG TPA: aminomethyl-transferring glycine dehydrogenase subunit GcvPA [Bacillota bacterium]|nr:aminomethyl-transferring glycine dehydrogenase subunit GcvPA [Bacillota bacterium]